MCVKFEFKVLDFPKSITEKLAVLDKFFLQLKCVRFDERLAKHARFSSVGIATFVYIFQCFLRKIFPGNWVRKPVSSIFF